ncbi:large proline-rich protein bag6 isoform X1 [Ananas comosus]|uniref:Large proline-rich protein bag6 isoform X1 n=2 Tax=Ananas comosus TaxID=4615 RepID=A0A6P5FCX3_ANACO|nr:large proline-rich protein bag6 isoform X1 [Ananas comosus]CAD1835617.1 unnamed protein product [Ananas comosus var. bracteatus]
MADEAFKDGSSSMQEVGDGSDSTIEINVKTLDSQIYKFRVRKDLPIPALKEKIVGVTGVPMDQQRLIFRGKVLKDDHLLSEYHVEDGHTLHLVARQPAQPQRPTEPGAASEDSSRNNGNETIGNAQQNRTGQVSHSVVVGTVNIADQGEGMGADIARGIGELLRSLGLGILAPAGGVSSTSSTSVPPNGETEGPQNAGSRTQPGNPVQPGFAILNHQLQISPLLPAALSRHTVIPDSLATLLEFINRMDLALQNYGYHSSAATNVQHPQRSDAAPSRSRDLPTPEVLGSVIERARQLLTGSAASALSHIAQRLEGEATSIDAAVRTRIQNEAMHAGLAMQHLGAMLLELGRTTMTLRMGQSPAESFVNSGPSVYISATGPNPIMVQPFPLQTSSLFGVSPTPFVNGATGPLAGGDPSRNINIHIHAGTSTTGGGSTAGTRTTSGDAAHGEQPNMEQVAQGGNISGDSASSVRGMPARTVVAAIPARSPAESGNHVLSVIYPIQVRPQSPSLPNQPAPQPNAAVVIPQTFSGPGGIPAVVAQINARATSALSGNVPGQNLSSFTLRNEAQVSHPTVNIGAQPAITSNPFPPTFSEAGSGSALSASTSAQNDNALSSATAGSSLSSSSSNTIVLDNINRGDSAAGSSNREHSDVPSSSSADKSMEKNSQPDGHMGASRPSSESDMPAPLGLGFGSLQPKRRKPAKPSGSETSSVNQNQQSITRGQQIPRSLVSQSSDSNSPMNDQGSSIPTPSSTVGQANVSNMISRVLQTPVFNNLLTNVAEQTGVSSPTDLRSMMEQCMRSPALRSALDGMVQQAEGQGGGGQELGSMLLGLGGQGGLGFSRMIQQMMPVVSQALSGGSPWATAVNGVQSEPRHLRNDSRICQSDMSNNRDTLIDLHQACERIARHDSPADIFHAVLEGAGRLNGEDNSFHDLAGELSGNTELANEYMSILRNQIHQRLQSESNSENKS